MRYADRMSFRKVFLPFVAAFASLSCSGNNDNGRTDGPALASKSAQPAPPPVDSAALLLADAGSQARGYWERVFTKCGNSYFLKLNDYILVVEYRDLLMDVSAQPLDEADRLNGVRWRGSARLAEQPFRTGTSGGSSNMWTNGRFMYIDFSIELILFADGWRWRKLPNLYNKPPQPLQGRYHPALDCAAVGVPGGDPVNPTKDSDVPRPSAVVGTPEVDNTEWILRTVAGKHLPAEVPDFKNITASDDCSRESVSSGRISFNAGNFALEVFTECLSAPGRGGLVSAGSVSVTQSQLELSATTGGMRFGSFSVTGTALRGKIGRFDYAPQIDVTFERIAKH
jgi:hypothetical protein